MPRSAHAKAAAPADLFTLAYPTPWRVVAATLVAVSRGSLPALFVLGLLTQQPIPLAGWLRALAVLVLFPGLAAWLIGRAFRATVEVLLPGGAQRARFREPGRPGGGPDLIVRGRDLQIEIPCAAIARVTPWVVPLPGPGVSLWMQSGRRVRYGLQLADPTVLVSTLADVGGVAVARQALRHPVLVYAHAKSSGAAWRWYHLLAKFVGFALVPTAIWFHAHQHIAYGGILGQYYLEGLLPYVRTFAVLWGLASIYLLLYASVWRSGAEAVALLAAAVAPARAALVRRTAEIACRLAYYGGVPVLMLLPFLM